MNDKLNDLYSELTTINNMIEQYTRAEDDIKKEICLQTALCNNLKTGDYVKVSRVLGNNIFERNTEPRTIHEYGIFSHYKFKYDKPEAVVFKLKKDKTASKNFLNMWRYDTIQKVEKNEIP